MSNHAKFKDTKVGQFLLGKKGLFSELANTMRNGVLGVIKRLIVNEDSLSVNDKAALALMQEDIIKCKRFLKDGLQILTQIVYLVKCKISNINII